MEYCFAEFDCFPEDEFETIGTDRIHQPPGGKPHELTTGNTVEIIKSLSKTTEATIVRRKGPEIAEKVQTRELR
jgi:hypothetical protein